MLGIARLHNLALLTAAASTSRSVVGVNKARPLLQCVDRG